MDKTVYESTYIITPDLPEEDFRKIQDKFNTLLRDQGAVVTHQEVWGMRKLAYEIKRKTSGFYIYTEFELTEGAQPGIIAKLEQEYIYDEKVLRFLTIKMDKYSYDFNQRRKLKVTGKLPYIPKPEEVA